MLAPAAITRGDVNRAARYAQPFRYECDERLVRGAFDRRGRETHDDRVVPEAGYFCFSRAGNDADVELDASVGLTDHGSMSCTTKDTKDTKVGLANALCPLCPSW